jgi:hypothetical protein
VLKLGYGFFSLFWGVGFSPAYRKGIQLIFWNQDVGSCCCGFTLAASQDGNISELGDIGMSPGKSSLFFLTSVLALLEILDCPELRKAAW